MIKQIITWLRRDDERLEILRREIQQKEKPMDWEHIQKWIVYVLIAAGVMGFGVMVAMWILRHEDHRRFSAGAGGVYAGPVF